MATSHTPGSARSSLDGLDLRGALARNTSLPMHRHSLDGQVFENDPAMTASLPMQRRSMDGHDSASLPMQLALLQSLPQPALQDLFVHDHFHNPTGSHPMAAQSLGMCTSLPLGKQLEMQLILRNACSSR